MVQVPLGLYPGAVGRSIMTREDVKRLLCQHRQVRLYWLAVLSGERDNLPGVDKAVVERAYHVEQALGQLPADQRRLLGHLYMDKMLYDRSALCHGLSVSESTLYRMRNAALDNFIKAYT